MKKYYKILGLDVGASFNQVNNKYNELSKEFDPSRYDDNLKDFFISEQKKIDDAFEKISSSISNDNSRSDNTINNDSHPSTKNIYDSYKFLKLKEDATLGEINAKYKILIEEYNPDKQSEELKDFFKKEQDKASESYKNIITYLSRIENNNSDNEDSSKAEQFSKSSYDDFTDNIDKKENDNFKDVADKSSKSMFTFCITNVFPVLVTPYLYFYSV